MVFKSEYSQSEHVTGVQGALGSSRQAKTSQLVFVH